MRAGLLNEIVEVYRATVVQNEVGEQSTAYTKVATIRARVVHDGGQRGQSNNEVVFPYSKNIQVRYYQDINDLDRIKYDGKIHRILSCERDSVQQCIHISMEVVNE